MRRRTDPRELTQGYSLWQCSGETRCLCLVLNFCPAPVYRGATSNGVSLCVTCLFGKIIGSRGAEGGDRSALGK